MPDSFAEKTQRWVTLCANTEPMLGEMPAAQELHGKVKAATVELVHMADRIQELEGLAHTLTVQRRSLLAETSEDALRLKAHLQAYLGRRNPELVRLGIRPVTRRKNGTSAKAKAAAEAKAAAKASEAQSVNAEA